MTEYEGKCLYEEKRMYELRNVDLAKYVLKLEEKLANANNQLEGRDLEIKKLKKTYRKQRNKRIDELQKENSELKSRVGLSIECDKAQKNGELCLGYGGDEDEPCEQCKNCIKCECGYYQLGETEKDEQLTKAKDLLNRFLGLGNLWNLDCKDYFPLRKEAEQFLNEVEK